MRFRTLAWVRAGNGGLEYPVQRFGVMFIHNSTMTGAGE